MNRFILYLGIFFVFLPAYELEAYTTFEGAPRWWNVPDTNPMMPRVVKYYVNYKGTPDCEGEFEALQRAFQTWQNISTARISFDYRGTTTSMPKGGITSEALQDSNLVAWVEKDWVNQGPYFRLTDVARTMVYGNPQLFEFHMFFNGEGADRMWSANAGNSCPPDRYDVENIAAHEAGHVVGLAHDTIFPRDTAETMYPLHWCGEVSARTLEPDDIAGASYLYPYPATWLFNELAPIYRFEEEDLCSDAALSWNPMDAGGQPKDESIHLACQEGQYLSPAADSFVPLDSTFWPVCVIYGNNGTHGWDYREKLSDYHNDIKGPDLEIDKNDNCHIIWSEMDDSTGRVIYRKRTNGIWGTAVNLSGEVRNPRFPVIAVQHAPSAVSPHGSNVYAAWLEDKRAADGSYQPCLMFKRCVNGSWSQTSQIYGPAFISNPQLTLDSTGGVHIVWTGRVNGAFAVFWRKNTDRGDPGKWCTTVWKNEDVGAALSIAVDGYGYVHMLYVRDLGTNDKRIEYSSIYNLGNGATSWDTTGWDLGCISPANVRADYPHVVCDNMGFVHFFWSDNRYHAGQYSFDVFYRRNFRIGAPVDWDTSTNDDQGRPGRMIFKTRPEGTYWLADVSEPDTFGDAVVAVDAWTYLYRDWDVVGNIFRQDDTIRPWPGPFNSSPIRSTVVLESPEVGPQACYLSGSVNQLIYFAPTDCRLSYYSIDGRLMKAENVKGAGTIKPAGLSSGVYFARIQSSDGESKQAKVVIIN